MELKNYQKRVLRELDAYMSLLNSTQSLNAAYNKHWEQLGIAVGFSGLPPYNDVLPGVPHVCFKVPTGGGKTLLACAALRHIFGGMGMMKTKAVVWLVPSNAILEQTLRDLRNPEHPYRQQINFDFSSRVEVYDGAQALNGQSLSPASVQENLSIFVLSYDALRIKKKDGRKVYQENGNLAQFVPHYTDRDSLIPDVDETALIQVLNQMSPVVIVDESHNAQSELSIEMLKNLNPSFVLDLTATPKKNSNIISIVDARELKKENMVKLPVIIYNRQTKDDVLIDAIQLRGSIEAQSKAEKEQNGTYIRPIVLFQAQPKGKENAATFEKLKAELIEIGIPQEQIAIKTSEINELKGVNLLAADCPIRYIITVNALKEGWDCSFAYILATLANRTSRVDVEQIVGRVLRLPYARKHSQSLLNMAYVLTSSVDFRTTVENVVKGLNRAGFSEKEYRIGSDLPEVVPQPDPVQQTIDDITPEEPEADAEEFVGFDTAHVRDRLQAGQTQTSSGNGTPDSIAQMAQEAERQGAAFEAETEQAENMGIPLMGGSDMRKHYEMQSEYEDALTLELPMFFEDIGASLLFEHDHSKVSRESLADGFTLADKDTQITFGMSQGDIVAVDVKNDARPKQISLSEREAREFKTIVLTYPPERRKELCIDKIYQLMNRMDFLSASDLRKYIQRIVDQMSSEELSRMEGSLPAYAAQIRQKIMSLLEEYREKRFFQRIETNEIIVEPSYKFPKVISPTVTMFPISKSLYTDEADVNDFEHRVISALAGLSNVRWWHRVIERNANSFVLNGFINHYPDFIVATEKGNIILVETKGDDRDNSDSKAKLRLGRKWAELAGSKYRYYMVFDENDTGFEGAYRVSEFMELMKRL